MKTKISYKTVVAAMVSQCAEAGKKLAQTSAMVGDLQPLFLYCKPSTNEAHGDLLLVARGSKVPDGYYLATDDKLHIDVPYDNYFSWVHGRCTRLEILSPTLCH